VSEKPEYKAAKSDERDVVILRSEDDEANAVIGLPAQPK
jgi:hypothetical protein